MDNGDRELDYAFRSGLDLLYVKAKNKEAADTFARCFSMTPGDEKSRWMIQRCTGDEDGSLGCHLVKNTSRKAVLVLRRLLRQLYDQDTVQDIDPCQPVAQRALQDLPGSPGRLKDKATEGSFSMILSI